MSKIKSSFVASILSITGLIAVTACVDAEVLTGSSEKSKPTLEKSIKKRHSALELQKWKDKDFCERIQKGVEGYANSDLSGKNPLPPVDVGGEKMEFPQWQKGSLELGVRNSSPHTTEAYFSKFDADNDGHPDLVVRNIYYSHGGSVTHEDLHVLPYQELGDEDILKITVDEEYKYQSVRMYGQSPGFWEGQYDPMMAKNKISAFGYKNTIYFIFYNPMDLDLPHYSSREDGFLVAKLGEAKSLDYEGAPVISSLKYQCLYIRSNVK